MSRSILVIALFSLLFFSGAQAAGRNSNALESVLRSISAQQMYRTTDEIGEIVNAVAAERAREQQTQEPPATPKAPPPPEVDVGKFAKVLAPKIDPSPRSLNTEVKPDLSPEETEIREVLEIMNSEKNAASSNVIQQPVMPGSLRVIDLDGESVAPLQTAALKSKPSVPSKAPAPPKTLVGLYTYGPIRSGMTLAKIAANLLPSNQVTIVQMMWMLYQKNKQAFVDQDINGLKPNSTLNVPSLDEVAAIGQAEAEAAIARLRALSSRTASTRPGVATL